MIKCIDLHFEREEVQQEFAEFRRSFEAGKNIGLLLENFIKHLPYSEVTGLVRPQIETFFKYMLGKRPTYDPTLASHNYSEVRRRQTNREFYQTIDEVLKELGLFEPVKEMNRLGAQLPELNRLVYPAYFKLRDRGYNRYPDLTK